MRLNDKALRVSMAPARNAVVWDNLKYRRSDLWHYKGLSTACVVAVIMFWSIPVAAVQVQL